MSLAEFCGSGEWRRGYCQHSCGAVRHGQYATIEYSDGKDDGLALRIDSLEQLTTGNQADLGGASWTCDDEVRESHFRTRKDDQVAASGYLTFGCSVSGL